MPTRQDVDLARAAIDRGFLTIKESVKCLEIQRDYENAGQEVPLERIFIERDFLTQRQLHLLKESLAKADALRHIGHYEIMSKVGAGGMGTVYQAKDKKAERIVALKVLSPAHASNREYIARFLREAHASGQLSHPNIVQGIDAGEANGQYYFAMEFIDGVTVASMLKDGRPIPEQQALDIAIQISKALEHAEENNLIHRDVKPDNIMITEDGTAKLADLGLARLTKGDPGAQEQKIFGTPYYASPEQCQGNDELDTKTDMYSFGTTLFHMLAGRVPFDDETPEEIMTRHLRDKRPYLKDLNVQLSHGVSKIVRKLMAVDKRERYPSMSEVTKDLTLVRMGRSPRLGEKSRYDSSEYRYRSETGTWRTRPVNRQKTIVQIAVSVAAALAILAIVFLVFQWTQSGPDNKPDRPPDKQGAATPPTHQSYFEDLLSKQRSLPSAEFLDKLDSVTEKYPGTESARRAAEAAAKIRKKLHSEAEALFGKMAAEAMRLRDRQRYQDAINKLVPLPAKYGRTEFAEDPAELRKAIRRQAEVELRKIGDAAGKLAAEKKFAEAAGLYRPVVEKFGIPELKSQAEAEIKRLEKTDADERARATEEAGRKAEEERERIRNERRAIRTAFEEGRGLVEQNGDFGGAAEKLRAAADVSAADRDKRPLVRAASDLDELRKLFDGLKRARAALKDKPVTLVRKDGVKLTGAVFSVTDERISLVSGERAIRSVAWRDIAPHSIKELAKAKSGGKLSATDHRAIAALFLFSGRADDARTELRAMAALQDQADAAARRLEDIEFFLKSIAAPATAPESF
ncbi:MAG: serine/threonine-protein kinase [Planctomycetota bacterium]